MPTNDGQTVKDVVVKVCGRVPWRISAVLKRHITNNNLTHALAFSLGQFTHLGRVQGGGAQLNCIYALLVRYDGAAIMMNELQKAGVTVIVM